MAISQLLDTSQPAAGLLYVDTKNAPDVLRRAGVQFPGQAALQRGRKKILTEKTFPGGKKRMPVMCTSGRSSRMKPTLVPWTWIA